MYSKDAVVSYCAFMLNALQKIGMLGRVLLLGGSKEREFIHIWGYCRGKSLRRADESSNNFFEKNFDACKFSIACLARMQIKRAFFSFGGTTTN